MSVNLDTLQTFHLERGLVLYFGRKAKKGIPRPSTDSSANVGAETFIPILLPKSAKNASRLHCSTRLLPAEDEDKVTVEIRVTGMNGMKIDGKLYRKGSVALSTVEPGQRMKLHFWGWDAQLVVAESEVSLDSDDGLSDGEDESRWRASSGEESDHDALPSSSSASKSRQHSLVASSSTSLPRASSPALSYLSDASSSSERNAAASAAFERADALMTSLNLDLPGLIASAIVFHPRATVAVDEITRALLRETGSLWKILGDDEAEVERKKETQEGEDEAVDAWREMVQEILTEEDMFGAIDNSGLKVRFPSSPGLSISFLRRKSTLRLGIVSASSLTLPSTFSLTGRRRSTRRLPLLLLSRTRPFPRPRRRSRAVRQARSWSASKGRCAVLLQAPEFEEE